ncbi:MAG: VWA domain-containing protein [Bacteroidota bacterium]
MEMLWPTSLYLLGLVPLMLGAYIWILRRRRPYALRYSSLSLLRQAVPRASRWRRHIPFALFLLAMASLIMAAARPAAPVEVPSRHATILLAMDVSRSMCSTDIHPNRMAAAKAAALSFIAKQPDFMQIGIVAFAGFAELVQEPTTDQELLRDAVDNLTTGRRTAIGSAILKSIEGLAEFDPNIAPLDGTPVPGSRAKLPPPGQYAPAIIVLLTDGVSNSGPLPLEAAQEAAARGIRVYTIGFGTENPGSLPDCDGRGNTFRFLGQNGSWGGGGFFRGLDEATLRQIADLTGGDYYAARSAGELQQVFREIPTYLITTREYIEISALFAAAGAIFVVLAMAVSLFLHPLP